MNWLETYKPKILSEFKTNITEIKKAQNWIESYKKKELVPKVLLIIGPTGIGKTILADIILKEYNYEKIELNSTDLRSQKKIGDFLKKSLTYKNVIDMFNDGNKPVGILLDEIDTICKLSDKGGFTEFLSILKQNEKYETLQKNKLDKKKVKKTKILVDDYIKIYNPIICTSNDISDKKITELKKYSEVIYLETPTNEELICIMDDIYSKNNKKITNNVKVDIIEYSKRDIRRLIMILEDLFIMSKDGTINKELFEQFKKAYCEKKEEIQLIDSTKSLIIKKLSIKECELLFDIDCLLIPLMLYHNSINFIKNIDDTPKKKLSVYKNVLESLCIHDTIQTNIFEVQDWDELYNFASLYGSYIPNYYMNELKSKKNDKKIDIQFTSLLNKISQMYVNKKLLNSAKFSIGKINLDLDELIYLTQIMSEYFENYKESTNSSNDQEDDEDNQENDLEDNINYTKNSKIPYNDSKLIKFMNRYSINIDGLENILKIEKLNKINEKSKKKFTLKIKKEISDFLITK